MKHHITILIFLLFSTTIVQGQNTSEQLDSIVNEFNTNLKKSGITKIGYTSHYCIGGRIRTKTSAEKDYCYYDVIYYQLYLFWQDNDKTFLKKFDNCGAFNKIEFVDNCFFDNYIKYKDEIKNEVVKPLQTRVIKGVDTVICTYSIDHSCNRKIVFFDNQDTTTKYIDYYDILKTAGSNDQPNINYETNIQLKIVEWDKLTSDFIERLEKKTRFKRVLSEK